MYSNNSFIGAEYFLVLDPPNQDNMKPFGYSHCPSIFIGWGCVAVPGRRLQAILVVGEGLVSPYFSTFTLARLVIVILKNVFNWRTFPPPASQRDSTGRNRGSGAQI